VLEGSFLSYDRLHAAHAGTEFRAFDVQLDAGGELTGVTERASAVGSRDLHHTHRSQNRLGT
jgi:hypothetical protein